MNAPKNGLEAQSLLILGESPEAFAQTHRRYYDRHTPAGPEQRFHLDTAVRHEWILRRFQKVEEQLWARGGKKSKTRSRDSNSASTSTENPSLMRARHGRLPPPSGRAAS